MIYATHTACPWCERTKDDVLQVGGAQAPPEPDGRSVIICNVCGTVYLFEGASPKATIPAGRELAHILASMPDDVRERARILVYARVGAVLKAVRRELWKRREIACTVAELVELTAGLAPLRPSRREIVTALYTLKVVGFVLFDGVDPVALDVGALLPVPALVRWLGGA